MQVCAAIPLAGNAAGLLGTLLLAYGAVRGIPVATRLYRLSVDIAELAAEGPTGGPAMAAEPRADRTTQPDAVPAALRDKLEQQERTYKAWLVSWREHLAGLRDRWTWRETAATVLGLILTIASDALPLWAGLACPQPPPVQAVGAATAPTGIAPIDRGLR